MATIHAPNPTCPRCRHESDHHSAAVRQGKVPAGQLYPGAGFGPTVEFGVIDVGWHCANCGHEWGFELLGPVPAQTETEGD